MRKLVIANWKLFPETYAAAEKLYTKTVAAAKEYRSVSTVIAPPALYISGVKQKRLPRHIALGAQDGFWEDSGAYTGMISMKMLADCHVKYVIVGHSERRARGETDDEVAEKVVAAIRHNMIPVICVGEKKRDQAGTFYQEVVDQVRASLAAVPAEALGRLYIAYEPIWAISSNEDAQQATPDDAVEMVHVIRKGVQQYYTDTQLQPADISVLYGGSVSGENAHTFLNREEISGVLVGSASHRPDEFARIIAAADDAYA